MQRPYEESPEERSAREQEKQSARAEVLQLERVGRVVARPTCERAILQRVCEKRVEHLRSIERSYNPTENRMGQEVGPGEHPDDVPSVSQRKKS